MEEARICQVCLKKGKPDVAATYVATGADGLQWFECEDHEPSDNIAEVERVKREPIGDWYRRAAAWRERRSRDTDPAPAPPSQRLQPLTVELRAFEVLPGVTRFLVPAGGDVTLIFHNAGDSAQNVFAFVTAGELYYGSLAEESSDVGDPTTLTGVADELASEGLRGDALVERRPDVIDPDPPSDTSEPPN